MFSGDSKLPTLHFLKTATDDFGDREIDLSRYPQLFPLAWLRYGRTEEAAFVAIDGAKPACPVSLWWPEDGDLYPLADTLEQFLASLSSAKAPSVAKLTAQYKKADALSDRGENEAALAALDMALESFAFTPTMEMALADDLIEWVGSCFRLRGTIAVLGPPYARSTALADSERDFRAAITWHSLGFSTPGYAYIGLFETLVYEAGDYARALEELVPVLNKASASPLSFCRSKADWEYVMFFLNKARAFALLATNHRDADDAFRELTKLAQGHDDWAHGLIESLDTLVARVPQQATAITAIKTRLQ